MARLLLVDEEAKKLNILSTLLRTEGYKVVPVLGLDKTMGFVKSQQFDLLVVDVCGDWQKGIDLLKTVQTDRPDLPLMAIHSQKTAERSEEMAAVRNAEWIEKPFKLDEFIRKVQRRVDDQTGGAVKGEAKPAPVIEMVGGVEDIVAQSPSMRAVCDMLQQVGPTDITILVYGEKGVDKAQIARAIHGYSLRKSFPFVHLDCAATKDDVTMESLLFGSAKHASTAEQPGIFESANQGTLFLDSIDSLSFPIQEKLLKAIMDKQVYRLQAPDAVSVNVRLISGSTQVLARLAQVGAFNPDLARCLSLMPIELKPLRACKEDLASLVDQCLRKEAAIGQPIMICSPEALSAMERYPWPGNVSELKDAIHYAVCHTSDGFIKRSDLPPGIA